VNDQLPNTTQPKRRYLRRALLILIAGVLMWGGWLLVRPAYTVDVQAFSWPARPVWKSQQQVTECRITLDRIRARDIADAEVFISRWTDDQGKSLLFTHVPATLHGTGAQYTVTVNGLSTFRSMSPSFPVGTPQREVDWVQWQIGTSVPVSEGATTTRAIGTIVLQEGLKTKTKRVTELELARDGGFTIGGHRYELTGETSYGGIHIRCSNGAPAIKNVRFFDSNGDEFPVAPLEQGRGVQSRGKLNQGTDEPVLWEYRLRAARERRLAPGPTDEPGTTRYRHDTPRDATLLIEYWSEQRIREIPFDVTAPIQPSGEKHSIFEEPGPLPSPVPNDAWGPLATPDDPAIPFEVRVLSCEVTGEGVGRLCASFDVPTPDDVTVTSYDVTLTGCRDDCGNEILLGRPFRSAVGNMWQIEPQPGGQKDAQQLQWPAFELAASRTPSRGADAVTFTGTMRIKTGSDLKTVTIPDFKLVLGESFDVGPVTYTLTEIDEGTLQFETRGDLGLVRSLEILTPDRSIPCRTKTDLPYLYASDTYYTLSNGRVPSSLIGPDAPGVTVQATYLSEWEHWVVPFEITAPISRRQSWRPTGYGKATLP
jgi:hypothetical protein